MVFNIIVEPGNGDAGGGVAGICSLQGKRGGVTTLTLAVLKRQRQS